MGTGADHQSDQFTRLCDHIIERCRWAGYVAPIEWVQWLLRLELDAAARRDGVSFDQAAWAMTLHQATSLSDDLMEITLQNETS